MTKKNNAFMAQKPYKMTNVHLLDNKNKKKNKIKKLYIE